MISNEMYMHLHSFVVYPMPQVNLNYGPELDLVQGPTLWIELRGVSLKKGMKRKKS